MTLSVRPYGSDGALLLLEKEQAPAASPCQSQLNALTAQLLTELCMRLERWRFDELHLPAKVRMGYSSLLLIAPAGVRFDFQELATRVQPLFEASFSAAHAALQQAARTKPRTVHHIPVCYDGADLAELCEKMACSRAELIALHSEADYRVRLMGFAPGFAYLDGLPKALHFARKSSPRTRIPAGSVAIGGCHAGIYPQASAGGWHLLGTTKTQLFFAERPEQPCLLQPGDALRFVPTESESS